MELAPASARIRAAVVLLTGAMLHPLMPEAFNGEALSSAPPLAGIGEGARRGQRIKILPQRASGVAQLRPGGNRAEKAKG